MWLAAAFAGRAPLSSTLPFFSPLPSDCARELPARLTQAGLVGWVAFRTDGMLIVEVSPPVGWSPDHAAQAVWSVFDAVAALPPTCPYRRLEVTVSTSAVRLRARAAAADIRAWAADTLDDAGLIERVAYTEELLSPGP
jgi:hypothetical protein